MIDIIIYVIMSIMQKGNNHKIESISKQKLSALKRDDTNRIKALPRGEKHWNYSEKPTVLTLHKRIHRKYGKASSYVCKCGIAAKDWAFIGRGEYTDNRDDYTPLCRKCHIALDKHYNKVDRSKHKIIRNEKGQIVTTVIIN